MACPITQGGHNEVFTCAIKCPSLSHTHCT